jgi:hypothetical protein
MCLDNPVKRKNKKEPGKIARCLSSTPHFINMLSIQFLAVKSKYKIDYFDFFMNIALSGRKLQDLPVQVLMLVGIAKKPIGPKKLTLSENFPLWNKKPSIFISRRFYAGKNLRRLIFWVKPWFAMD